MASLVPTVFTNIYGSFKNYFIQGNPRKEALDNRLQYVFKNCVICGDQRLSDGEWAKDIRLGYRNPMICDKGACDQALDFFPGFVPPRFYLNTGEETGKVPFVTTCLRFDRCYEGSEAPYQAIQELEKYPIEARIPKISEVYRDHVEKWGIQSKQAQAKDPFLKILLAYREKNNKLLKHMDLAIGRDDSLSQWLENKRSEDLCYPDPTQIPKVCLSQIKILEQMAVTERIPAIDEMYFDYAKENQIVLKEGNMADTEDLFLKGLAGYREKCVGLLKKRFSPLERLYLPQGGLLSKL